MDTSSRNRSMYTVIIEKLQEATRSPNPTTRFDLDSIDNAQDFESGGFDKQLFLLRAPITKRALELTNSRTEFELSELSPMLGARRWLLTDLQTQLHPPRTKPRLVEPRGARTIFQAPFSGSRCWTDARGITGKGKKWSIDADPQADAQTGSINTVCTVYHVEGGTRTLGCVTQQFVVPAGTRALRILATVDILYDVFAWMNGHGGAGAGWWVFPAVGAVGEAISPDSDLHWAPSPGAPTHWAPPPIVYQLYLSTGGEQVTDSQSYVATIDVTLPLEGFPSPNGGPVDVSVAGLVHTVTDDKDHSGAGARIVLQVRSLAVEPVF